jgi:ABC-2 type transport system permease protein
MTTIVSEPTTKVPVAPVLPPVDLTDRVGIRKTAAHSLTMAYRGLLKFRRNPEQFFDVVFQPILFTVMFAYIFGGAISGSVSAYLPLIIPGILVQTVLTTSMVTGTQLREDMDKGVFDRFRSLPIARISPLIGALLADGLRYAIAITITFVTGIAMGWRPEFWGTLAAALLVIVCAFALSWIWAWLGVIARSASSVQGISLMILFPLTFLSNAFVQVHTMPGWLQGFVKVNPISHLVSAVRSLANDGAADIHVVWSLVGAAVIVAIFAPLAVRTYSRQNR